MGHFKENYEVWGYARWIRNEKIKNLKKEFAEGSPKRNWRNWRYPLSKVSSYLKLNDDAMPINSHVTSEEENFKVKIEKKIDTKTNLKKKLCQCYGIDPASSWDFGCAMKK